MLEDAKTALRESGKKMRNYMQRQEDKATQVYSSAMD